MIDNVTAYDNLMGFLHTVLQEQSIAVLGSEIQIEWPGVVPGSIPKRTGYFARVTFNPLMTTQTSLSTCVVTAGNRRFTTGGLIVIQLLGPQPIQDSQYKLLQLGTAVRNKLSKNLPDGIWVRNPSVRQLPPEDGFNRCNVVTEFQYDENF